MNGTKIKSRKNFCFLNIRSCEKFCLLHVLESSHTISCLPKNVCKFIFHCYACVYVALVSMIVGVQLQGTYIENFMLVSNCTDYNKNR
ncbi:hypothetical protein T4B_13780, partial [Trichinella pseudospiralis]